MTKREKTIPKTTTNEDLASDIGGLKLSVGDLTKTVDNLAVATAKGFVDVQKGIDDRFRLTLDRFERLEDDVTDIKRALGPLVQMMAMNDRDVHEIKHRLTRVERKVGIIK